MDLFKSLLLALLILFIAGSSTHAQDEVLIIRNIEIRGIKHTKPFVVERELDFAIGDSLRLSEIPERFERNEDNLKRLGLFFYIRINIKNWRLPDPYVDIVIDLKESWYFLPVPVVKLADRNFNVWVKDYNASLDRLVYGLRAYHTNLTGRNDYLKVVAQFGFSQRFNVLYRFPYLNKRNTLGVNISVGHTQSRNSVYYTEKDRQLFLDADEGKNFKSTHFATGVRYRRKIDVTHDFRMAYNYNRVSDTIIDLNPDYFMEGNQRQEYFSLFYSMLYDKRNHKKQPTKGYAAFFTATQVGIGIFDDVNYGFMQIGIHHYLPLSKKISWRLKPKARIHFNKEKIPYNHSRALGHREDLVRGYEHYVVDGTDFFLGKTGFVWEFFQKTYNFSGIVPMKKFDAIPLRLFLSLNFDAAYVSPPSYENQNVLDDRWISGYGPALEILLMEAMLFKVEYSINDLGESGVFLHTQFSL